MRPYFPTLVMALASLHCDSNTPKALVRKSIENPKSIEGAWHLYDAESNSLIGKGPLFELAAQQKFVDSAEILCHFSKLKAGDLLELMRRHSDASSTGEKLQNCPAYSYEGDIRGVQIFSSAEGFESPIVTINFADMKSGTTLRDGRSGQLYYLYVELKQPQPVMGTIMLSPNKTQINRVPGVLVRVP